MNIFEEAFDMVAKLLGELLDNVVIGIADFVDGLELPQQFGRPDVHLTDASHPVELTDHGGIEL